MATSVPSSGKSKARHTPAQKKAARDAREKAARAQLKGRRERPTGDREDRGGESRGSFLAK